jgi:hypothetical protein
MGDRRSTLSVQVGSIVMNQMPFDCETVTATSYYYCRKTLPETFKTTYHQARLVIDYTTSGPHRIIWRYTILKYRRLYILANPDTKCVVRN